jgi:hypothetical protein
VSEELLDKIEARLVIYRDMLLEQGQEAEVFAYHATGVQGALRLIKEIREGDFEDDV